MTLVETVLSVAIAVLLLTILFSLYHAVMRTAEGQGERARTAGPPVRALDWFARDLRSAFLPADDEACAFLLAPDARLPDRFHRLDLCTLAPRREGTQTAWVDAWHVSYRTQGGASSRTLVREARPLAGPGSLDGPETNLLLRAVRAFRVEVYDGEAWHAAWPTGQEGAQPKLVRVRVDGADDKPLVESEFLVPAANPLDASPGEATAGGEAE